MYQRVCGKRKDWGKEESVRRKREVEDLLVLLRPAEWCRLQQKNSNKLRLSKRKVALVPQSKQLARMPEQPLSQEKETEPSVQITKS